MAAQIASRRGARPLHMVRLVDILAIAELGPYFQVARVSRSAGGRARRGIYATVASLQPLLLGRLVRGIVRRKASRAIRSRMDNALWIAERVGFLPVRNCDA